MLMPQKIVLNEWVFSAPHRTSNGTDVIYAHMSRANGSEVTQRCLSPSALLRDSRPVSQYLVGCGVDYVNEPDPDRVNRVKAVRDIEAVHSGINQAALKAGKPHVYEGWLYWEFGDLDVEHALAFADSMTVPTNHPESQPTHEVLAP